MALQLSSHIVQRPVNHYLSKVIYIGDVDANYLAGLLRPQYSPEGSSRRLVEEKVVDHLQDFLLSLEDDNITGYSAPMA